MYTILIGKHTLNPYVTSVGGAQQAKRMREDRCQNIFSNLINSTYIQGMSSLRSLTPGPVLLSCMYMCGRRPYIIVRMRREQASARAHPA